MRTNPSCGSPDAIHTKASLQSTTLDMNRQPNQRRARTIDRPTPDIYLHLYPAVRKSMEARETCADILPKPHGLGAEWEVPTKWAAPMFMNGTVTTACVRALMNRLSTRGSSDLPRVHLIDTWQVDLKERLSKQIDNAFEFMNVKKTVSGLSRLVHAVFSPFQYDSDAIVVMPIDIMFYEEFSETLSAGHGLLVVFTRSSKTERVKAVLMDGSGYIPEWHNGILWLLKNLPSMDATTDETAMNVNFRDTKMNSERLAKLGITHQGNIEGYCAFLQWILVVNVACVGKRAIHKGHLNRLMFDDLLYGVQESEQLEPWQQMITKSFLHACCLKILRIISEDYPSEKDSQRLGWPSHIPFPDVSTIKSVRVRRVEKHGTVVLEKVPRSR